MAPGTEVAGRFTVLRKLAEGGFAVVYEATDQHSGDVCALKVLRPPPHSDAARAFQTRFTREAEVASRVVHPNVVGIRDWAITQGVPWIAMDLLTGHDLKRELTVHGGMAGGRVVPLFIAALDGLDVGHEQGIVHRDLKPGNLFLRSAGTPGETLILLDFGIARPTGDADEDLTATGHLLGTPRYYAPEYATKQLVTPALDVYQMGLILLEAIKGTPAVPHSDPYTCLLAHCQGQLDFPDSLRNSDLGDVLAKATSVNHKERYRRAGAFAGALRALDQRYIPSIEIELAMSGGAPSDQTVDHRLGGPKWRDSLSVQNAWAPRPAAVDTVEADVSLIADPGDTPLAVDSTTITAPCVPCPLCLTPTSMTGKRVLGCPRCHFRFDVPDPEELQPEWVSDLPLPVGFAPNALAVARTEPGQAAAAREGSVAQPAGPRNAKPTTSGAARVSLAPKPPVVPDLDAPEWDLEPMEARASSTAPAMVRARPSEQPASAGPMPPDNLGRRMRGRRRRSAALSFFLVLLLAAGGYAGFRVATEGVAALRSDVNRAGDWVRVQYATWVAPHTGSKP